MGRLAWLALVGAALPGCEEFGAAKLVPVVDSGGALAVDLDGDGVTVGDGDCWDDPEEGNPWAAPSPLSAADVYPGAPDDWYDGVDADCAGNDDYDRDGDGFRSAEASDTEARSGDDCDDADADVFPGAAEVCDERDNDCDGAVDGDDTDFDVATLRTFYTDGDGDGFGDPATGVESCTEVDGRVETGGDCDDADADVNPGADEVCDPEDVDEDCDGVADDADDSTLSEGMRTLYADGDGDGFGDPGGALLSCESPEGYVFDNTDCDDGDGAINPAAQEVCDAGDVDEDCVDGGDGGEGQSGLTGSGYVTPYGGAGSEGRLYVEYSTSYSHSTGTSTTTGTYTD